jgi:hypothetical protein
MPASPAFARPGQSRRAAATAGLEEKIGDCRSFTFPRLLIVWWFRFTAVLPFQDLAIPFPDYE